MNKSKLGKRVELTSEEMRALESNKLSPHCMMYAKLEDAYSEALKITLDKKAMELGYRNELDIISFAKSKNATRSLQAIQFLDWRDKAIDAMNSELSKIDAETKELTTIEELIAIIEAIQ